MDFVIVFVSGCNEEETNGSGLQDETDVTSPSIRNGGSQPNSTNSNIK